MRNMEPRYFAPQPKLGGGWIAFKDSPSPPAAPDYAAAATAQGQANVDAARIQGKLNNPNVYTPYGSQQVYWGALPQNVQQSLNGRTFGGTGSFYDQVNSQQGGNYSGPQGSWTDTARASGGSAGTNGGSSGQGAASTSLSSPQAAWGSPESISALNNAGLSSRFNPSAGSSQWYDGASGQFLNDTQAQDKYNSLGAASPSSVGGGSTQGTGGGPDQPTIVQTLNPQSQQIFDAQQRTRQSLADLSNTGAGIAQGVLDKPFSFSGPGIQTSLGGSGPLQSKIDTSGVAPLPVNAGQTGQAAIMSRLQPQIDRENSASDAQLANQGITQGSEAYRNAKTVLGQQHNDLLNQAAVSGLNLDFQANNQGFGQASTQGQFANAAQNQGFNQGLQGGQFANTAQNQAMVQALQQRGLPLNEITALMSGSQIQNPQFQGYSGSQVAPAPVFAAAQAQGGANQNLYNAQVGQQNAQTSGLFGLGGAALNAYALSDRRLKSKIKRIGTHPMGFGLYEYLIAGVHAAGVMADEVEKVLPEAVIKLPSGYMAVNYGML